MKPRHAAALALAGWYLMVPPSMSETNWVCSASLVASVSHELFGTGNEKVCAEQAKIADMNAPLSEWHEASPFETLSLVKKGRRDSLTRRDRARRSMEQCVSRPTIRASRQTRSVYRQYTQHESLFFAQQTFFFAIFNASDATYLRKLFIEATPLHRLAMLEEASTAGSPLQQAKHFVLVASHRRLLITSSRPSPVSVPLREDCHCSIGLRIAWAIRAATHVAPPPDMATRSALFASRKVNRDPDHKDYEQQVLHDPSVAAFRVSATSLACNIANLTAASSSTFASTIE